MIKRFVENLKKRCKKFIKDFWGALFGKTLYEQETQIIKLLKWTLAFIIIGVVLFFINRQWANAMIAVIFLMWGWRVLMAVSGINKLSALFDYNIAVIVIIFILWLMVGYLAGMVCFLLGISRLIWLKTRK